MAKKKPTSSFHFTVLSSQLRTLLDQLEGTLSSRPVLPILEYALISDREGYLDFRATDLENTLVVNSEIQHDGDEFPEGGVAIPPKLLAATLKNLPEQPVTIHFFENGTGKLVSAYGHYDFPTDPGGDYPSLPQLDDDHQSIAIGAGKLITIIQRTLWASSTDELRPAMTGIYFDGNEKDELRAVTTDAHKLVLFKAKARKDDQLSRPFILPKKGATMAKKLFGKTTGDLEMTVDSSNVSFRSGTTQMISRLIDARYPDYRMIMPTSEYILTVNREDLVSAASRLIDYANNITNQGVLILTKKQLTLTSSDVDRSKAAKEELVCQWDGPQDFTVGFNLRFVIDSLSTLMGEEVQFSLKSPTTAALVACPDSEEEGQEVVILMMPVMLS